jgi:hypothetical protein
MEEGKANGNKGKGMKVCGENQQGERAGKWKEKEKC